MPRLVRSPPCEVLRNHALDHLREVLGVPVLLEGVGVVERIAELSVDGPENLAELGAPPAPVMKGRAGPEAVSALVAPGLAKVVDAVLMPSGGIEHRRGEHEVRHRLPRAEERLHEVLLAARVVVAHELPKDGTGDGPQVVGAVVVEARAGGAIGRELVEGGEELLVVVWAGGKARGGAAPAMGGLGRPGQDVGLGVHERHDCVVVLRVGVGEREPLVERVVGGVVNEPGADVAVEARLKLAVCPPEGLDGAEPPLPGIDADAVQELVDVYERKRRRSLLDVARAHACAPGEVTPELPVIHRIVGREVARERSGEGAVVRVVLHEAGLLHEEARLGP